MTLSLDPGAQSKRCRRIRGKASDQQCWRCLENGINKVARDWAHIHTEIGSDVWADFVPLCRSCHQKYDKDARAHVADMAAIRWSRPEEHRKWEVRRNSPEFKKRQREAVVKAAGIRERDSKGRFV